MGRAGGSKGEGTVARAGPADGRGRGSTSGSQELQTAGCCPQRAVLLPVPRARGRSNGCPRRAARWPGCTCPAPPKKGEGPKPRRRMLPTYGEMAAANTSQSAHSLTLCSLNTSFFSAFLKIKSLQNFQIISLSKYMPLAQRGFPMSYL